MGFAEGKVLWRMLRGQPREGTLQQRLESFYRPQAAHYDDFRERLLHGREQLIELLDIRAGQRLVELGGGTGRNLEFYGDQIPDLKSVELVDLCSPLLELANARCKKWNNVIITHGDATQYHPHQPVDRVYFSYALTMIPDWFRAVENALSMLRPGGLIGVVDFYVSRARADETHVQHGFFTRLLWPNWFAHDGVYLSPDHLPYLESVTEPVHRIEASGTVPFLPGLRAPYYVYIGMKPHSGPKTPSSDLSLE